MPNLLLGVLRPAGIAPPPPSGLAGYVCGGELEVFATPTDTVFKLDFSDDSWSTTTSAPDILSFTAGFSDNGVAGYVLQGDGSDELYKWTLPTDSSSQTTSVPDGLDSPGAFSNTGVAGYMASSPFMGPDTADLFRLAYPADTFTVPTTLPGQFNTGGAADPGVAGYMPVTSLFDGPGNGLWNKVTLPTESTSLISTFVDTDFTLGPAVFADPGVRIYGTNVDVSNLVFNTLNLPTESPDFQGAVGGAAPTELSSGFADDGVAGYAQVGEDDGDVVDDVYKAAFPTWTSYVTSNMPAPRAAAGAFANMG